MNFVINHSYLIPLLPLIAAMVSGFFGARYLKGKSHWPIWASVGVAAVMSTVLLFGMLGHTGGEESHTRAFFQHSHWFTWIDTGGPSDASTAINLASGELPTRFVAGAGALFDPLTAVMLMVVCGIGLLITIFAAGYMKGEEGYFRFFAYLGLFIFSMTCLVMGDNLVMLFLGWEGVGLCSYLLIGYYYDKPAARDAAKKAFIVNRIGDLGFAVGIFLTFLVFGTVSYFGGGSSEDFGRTKGFLDMAAELAVSPDALAALPQWKQYALYAIPLCLMVGAFGKSAQFPLYVWLPDAMEGPTPVSALIHAATMVTAGIYMIARCSTLFVANEAAMATVVVVGLFTALLAATIALRQFDLKKVFAYSTVSQLGFMFVAVGLFAPVAGVFHLVTHAFFKALLFLSAGVVMHAMAGELDMRKMSGLKRMLPKTRWLMLVGCLALAGVVPFSGFWSKDEIVVAAFSKHTQFGNAVGGLLLLTAFLTAYYTFRLYFRVFEGPEVLPAGVSGGHGGGHGAHAGDHAAADSDAQAQAADDHGHHDHEPRVMIVPLVILAAGAVLAGFLNTPFFGHFLGDFLGRSPSFASGYRAANGHFGAVGSAAHLDPLAFGQHSEDHTIHWLAMLASIAVAGAGIALAYYVHLADRRKADALAGRVPALTRTLDNKYWVDEIYAVLVVAPLRTVGKLFYVMDRWIVDGAVNVVSWMPLAPGWAMKLGLQRGYLQGYAVAMLFGIAVILLIVFL